MSEYDSDPNKAEQNFIDHSITFSQAWIVFNKKYTKQRFFDMEHSSTIEKRYYALGKLKNHGVIRINYTIRNGKIRIINAFKAGAEDCDKYYFGEEDF